MRSSGEPVLFALRVRDFERIAWRDGRDFALTCEREAVEAFAAACGRVLRDGDALAHAPQTDVFLAALLGPPPRVDVARTARTVLDEIVRQFTEQTGFTVEAGWTIYERGTDAERALRSATGAALDRGRRERDRFAFFARIGHEMRSPLMSIDGYLTTVLERDLDEAARRRFIEIAVSEATRLRRLVEGMYALSVVDLDAGVPSEAACDVQKAIERACDAIYPAAARRGTRLFVRSRVDVAIPLAAEHAVQVFVGFLENAVKHGNERGRIEIYLQEKGAGVEILFDDDGPGVAEDDRVTIFGPLVRGRDAVAPGNGLGLSIARAMIERAGGHVGVSRSALGGARFIV
ncbi:MAG: HAMP domain-containing histidine kinase, partial [Candidatus Eremiobacteraeota bacterium]|nr:HAMP domain-containing histidine kinase [Candidatus Eremiobacteraeota bacterium]